MPQTRVKNGIIAQDIVCDAIRHLGGSIQYVAPAGSQRSDIVADINGSTETFEVKHCYKQTSPIALYSETIKRGRAAKIDSIIPIMTHGTHHNINDAMIMGKLLDETVGFVGDCGVPSTGRLPLMTATDIITLDKIRDIILSDILSECGNYLALVCPADSQRIHTYWTGKGTNTLNAPSIPQLRFVAITTYGASPCDTVRVAIKLKFHRSTGSTIRPPNIFAK